MAESALQRKTSRMQAAQALLTPAAAIPISAPSGRKPLPSAAARPWWSFRFFIVPCPMTAGAARRAPVH